MTGAEVFLFAGALSGIRPVWAAEVEPYPIAVTRSRFPMMQHLGSVTEVHGDKVQPVDVITFGLAVSRPFSGRQARRHP